MNDHKPSPAAHNELLELWISEGVNLSEWFLDRVFRFPDGKDREDRREQAHRANQHLHEQAWNALVKGGQYPIWACLYSINKPYKAGANYTTIAQKWRDENGKNHSVNLGTHKVAALVLLEREEQCTPTEIQVWDAENFTLVQGWHASHWYCHDSHCVNPLHLLPEASATNMERNCCKKHKNNPDYCCPHTPTCKDCAGTNVFKYCNKWKYGYYA